MATRGFVVAAVAVGIGAAGGIVAQRDAVPPPAPVTVVVVAASPDPSTPWRAWGEAGSPSAGCRPVHPKACSPRSGEHSPAHSPAHP